MMKNKPKYYSIWTGMRQRCRNPLALEWINYGGRGILVCERWNDYKTFEEDMGERPSKLHSIDRIDNNGNYEPGNCRWATRREQSRNIRANRRVTVEGKEYLAVALAEIGGLKIDTIVDRAKNNLSMVQLLKPEKMVFTAGLALGGKANGKRQKAKTHCPNGHEYSGKNLILTPQGWRKCRECFYAKERARLSRKRALG